MTQLCMDNAKLHFSKLCKPSIQLLCTGHCSGSHGKTKLVLCFKHLARRRALEIED